MSGLEIDHGGAIAVDTAQLRDVGARMRLVGEQYEEARTSIGRACGALLSEPNACPQVDAGALQRTAERLGTLRAELDDACRGTLLMADAFEVVELRAEAEALALTDAAAADAARWRIERLVSGDERVGVMAEWLVADAEDRRFEGMGRQFDAGGLLMPLYFAGAFVGVSTGLGKVGAGTPLQGRADPVRVTPVKTSNPAAPQGVAGALRRMPTSNAQVAVERYTMADGATRYVTYITGTKNAVPWEGGQAEPWDMKSNVELYQGQASASYQATLDALAAAGAEPGDRVDVVGYSQGGMIAAHLATESGYDVVMQLTAGSPQEPTLRDDQTLVQLRHSDDVVSHLAAGGSAAGIGSADSFTATRVGDPQIGVRDMQLQTHALETYIETAEMVDASDDPRAEALDAYWDELATAVEIERTEFHAERTR
jgi:dienelactone hydrolase